MISSRYREYLRKQMEKDDLHDVALLMHSLDEMEHQLESATKNLRIAQADVLAQSDKYQALAVRFDALSDELAKMVERGDKALRDKGDSQCKLLRILAILNEPERI